MVITEGMKKSYVEKVYKEMMCRGMSREEATKIIGKTGFMEALEEYPEEQLHYSIKSTVNEIYMVAARH